MTTPIQPARCERCGQPVLPDPNTPGGWVDQLNSRSCGGNPQFPHTATAPGQGPPSAWTPYPAAPETDQRGGGKKGWLIGGSVAGVVVVLAVVVVLVVTLTGKSDQTAAAPTQATPAATSGNAAAADANAPVPCDPGTEQGQSCFPPTVTGQAFLDRIKQKQEWPCFKKGDKDESGMNVSEPGVCRASNSAAQPYIVQMTIGYDTDTHDSQGKMTMVRVLASTGARSWKNEQTDSGKTKAIAVDAMGIAVANLWPEDKALQEEAKQAYAKIAEECAAGKGGLGPKTALRNGLEVACDPVTTTTVTGPNGPLISITQTMQIEAPYLIPGGN
jgi:hypothetical protein